MIILGHNPAFRLDTSLATLRGSCQPPACMPVRGCRISSRSYLTRFRPTRTCVRTAAANRNEPDLLKTEADSPEGFGAK
jgi:hypothetical protein